MSRLSASKVALARLCSWWARPETAIIDVEPGDGAKDGTSLHALCEAHVNGELVEPLQRVILSRAADPDRVSCMWLHARSWLDAHKSPWLRSEVPFVWDPTADKAFDLTETLDELGLAGHRAYADPEAWKRICERLGIPTTSVPATIDLYTIEDGNLIVYDICTGNTDKVEQLRACALMVARHLDVEDVRIVTLRVDDQGCYEHDHGTLDVFDLGTLAGEMAALVEAIPAAEPKPGGHCAGLYCPAFLNCPTTQQALAELVPPERLTAATPEAVRRLAFRMSIEIQSVEHAARLLPRVNLIRDAADAMRDALKGFAQENGGIPSAPGKVWGPGTSERSAFSRERAEALLRLLGATDEQIASCSHTNTITTFRERNATTKGRKARAA